MKSKPKTAITLLIALAALSVELWGGGAPIYQETFDSPHARLSLLNGAKLGLPGSGVSGKRTDLAYIGVPSDSGQLKNGPAAVVKEALAPYSLSAFSCSFWYLLDENGPELQVPLSTAGVMFLLGAKGFEVRIEHSVEAPKQYVFTPGGRGPHVEWTEKGRWIYAVFTWEQATNTMTFHQGTSDGAVLYMRDMTRDVPANATLPRQNLARYPETIGNSPFGFDRPLAGRIDNVRFFDRVITPAEMERMRQADVAGQPVKFD